MAAGAATSSPSSRRTAATANPGPGCGHPHDPLDSRSGRGVVLQAVRRSAFGRQRGNRHVAQAVPTAEANGRIKDETPSAHRRKVPIQMGSMARPARGVSAEDGQVAGWPRRPDRSRRREERRRRRRGRSGISGGDGATASRGQQQKKRGTGGSQHEASKEARGSEPQASHARGGANRQRTRRGSKRGGEEGRSGGARPSSAAGPGKSRKRAAAAPGRSS